MISQPHEETVGLRERVVVVYANRHLVRRAVARLLVTAATVPQK